MAARKNKIKLSKEWKEKIRISHIINGLIDCFDGKTELSANQIKIADMLLKKVAPDLSRVDGDMSHKHEIVSMPTITKDDKPIKYDLK